MSVFWERDEANWARHEALSRQGSCYQHVWRSNSRGGGTCVQCGDEVGEGEL